MSVVQFPKSEAVPQRATVYAVAVQKGGAGKTTTSTNLAVALAVETGRPVLAVDLDPQAHLTKALGVDKRTVKAGVNDVLFGDVEAAEAIMETQYSVDLMPATLDLAAAEKQMLLDPVDPNIRLRDVLDPLRRRYGFVVIDCPPTLGSLTLNALTAADRLVVPFEPNGFGTDGIVELLNTVTRVQRRLNPSLEVAGFLANRHRARTTLGRAVLESTRAFLRGRGRVFEAVVPESQVLQESVSAGVPVAFYKPTSAALTRVTTAYRALAQELLSEGGQGRGQG